MVGGGETGGDSRAAAVAVLGGPRADAELHGIALGGTGGGEQLPKGTQVFTESHSICPTLLHYMSKRLTQYTHSVALILIIFVNPPPRNTTQNTRPLNPLPPTTYHLPPRDRADLQRNPTLRFRSYSALDHDLSPLHSLCELESSYHHP